MKGVIQMKLGEKVLKLRKRINISQEQLGNQVGVTRQTISNWELGETSPNPEQLKLLSKALNIGIDELLENNIKSVEKDKGDKTENESNKFLKISKIIGIIIGILLFFFLVVVVSSLFFSNYFQTTATASGVETICEYKNEVIKVGIWKEYQSGNLYLQTPNQEILNKFKLYNYDHEEKMLNDITKYIEDNGGKCNIIDENNIYEIENN